MCKLSLHHLLFVVYLWQSVAFLECSAGNADQDQDFRSPQKVTTHCLENCSLATSTTPNINVKISSRQICYQECLRTARKQYFQGIQQFKPLSKRIKRDASRGNENLIQAADYGGEICNNAEKGRSLSESDGLHASFHKLRNTSRFFANVSWNPLPNRTANWTGYRLVYILGEMRPDSILYCRDLKKDTTFSIITNSSFGLLENSKFHFLVTSIPFVDNGFQDFQHYAVIPKTDALTDQENSTQSTYSKEVIKVTTPSSPDAPNNTVTFTDSKGGVTRVTTPSSQGNKTPVSKVAIPFIVSALVALTGVAAFVFCYLRRTDKPASSSSVAEFQFDAFIIYSTRDEDWIKKTLLPTLEDKHGLKCCVHFRDFIAGLPFRNNMVDSVYKSRKTVAVVSRSFFDSKYCGHELDFALHRLLEKRDNSLVVIKLDDVDKNKLPKALQKRSYIDYPHLKERQVWERNLVKCFKVQGE